MVSLIKTLFRTDFNESDIALNLYQVQRQRKQKKVPKNLIQNQS